jgi:uncharacterized protein (DUF58 family)
VLALLPALLDPRLSRAWVAFLGLLLALMLLDAALALPRRRLRRRVRTAARLAVGETGVLEVTLETPRWGLPTRIAVRVDLSPEFAPTGTAVCRLAAGGAVRIEQPLRALRRGKGRVATLWLRWTGPLGLMVRTVAEPREESVAIVPDVSRVRRTALKDLARRELSTGLRPVAWVGEGSEFESMREHAPGMDLRAISWRASARHRKLIAHEFRAERRQQVIVALDTGRLMREPVQGLPRLDHAIHAGLRLAHVALRVGDRVGMYAFDARARGFASPGTGLRAAHRLEHFTADLAYGSDETNFTLGLAELSSRLTRRSLVVLLTEFVDSITAELMVRNAAHLARRHVVVFVALGDPALAGTVARSPRSLDDVYESVVAADLVRERRVVLRRLERRGLLVVDAAPDAVGEPLLDHYLRIKRRELVG